MLHFLVYHSNLFPEVAFGHSFPRNHKINRVLSSGLPFQYPPIHLGDQHFPIPLVNVYIAIENHHLLWVNQLFLWPFSTAILT